MNEFLLEDRLWQKLFTDAQQALREGKPDDALRDFEAAVKLAEQFEQNDVRMVKALTGLGLTYSVKKEFQLAEKPLERSLALTTKYRGDAHPESLGILKNLAVIATNLKKFEEAQSYYSKAISIYEKSQPNHPDLAVLREQTAKLKDKINSPQVVAPKVASKTAPEVNQRDTNQIARPAAQSPAAALPKPQSEIKSAPPAPTKAPKPAQTQPQPTAPLPPPPTGPVPAPAASAASGMVDPENLSGVILENRYEVYDRIGEGGMSSIYRGKHLLMDRPVAIKILHKHLISSEKVRERFKQEARTASLLQHSNIVAVYDFGEAQGFFYLVMDFVDGISLSDLIRAVDRLPPERCVRILKQICDGLQHAHDHGILHRDLKPSNIMLLRNVPGRDLVKIVDFGIAKFIDDHDEQSLQLTQTGETIGSPLYMSPEQCRGEKLDARSDIYSLGCLAYKALTGSPPFTGSNQIDVYIKHMQTPAAALDTACPGLRIPQQLERIILKSLEKKPSDRFSSMAEFRGALNLLSAWEDWAD